MSVDLGTKSTAELETIIRNCERLGRITETIYLDAKREIAGRRSGNLAPEKTIRAIVQCGREGRYMSYKDIADANGMEWAKCRRLVPAHLDQICEYTEQRGWPLITAIVVNKANVATGTMTDDNRNGFLRAARLFGRTIDIDEDAFLRRKQRRVFEWCQQEGLT